MTYFLTPLELKKIRHRDEKPRDPGMATVGDRIRAAFNLLRKQGVECVLEWNESNHFRDTDLRTVKAFAGVLKRK